MCVSEDFYKTEVTEICLYHVDLEVDGHSHVIGHVILSHVHYVV